MATEGTAAVTHERISVALIRKMLASKKLQHEDSLTGWCENPTGYLVPTEPDANERELVRERLKAAITTIEQIDDYVCDVANISEDRR